MEVRYSDALFVVETSIPVNTVKNPASTRKKKLVLVQEAFT